MRFAINTNKGLSVMHLILFRIIFFQNMTKISAYF